jgi:hypothetical protein
VADGLIQDPKGYYALLGVASGATFDDVKSAFRQRAKEVHPDTNADGNAKSQFQKLSEAYECLSEPGARARYDTSGYPEPVLCSRCGAVTAQPRHRVFEAVVSNVFSTASKSMEGIFCPGCARKIALGASVISAAAGWWSLPRGPVLTVRSIVQNANGGYEPPGSKDGLLWTNLLAFLGQGKYGQVYNIARELRTADDQKIASKAIKLMDVLEEGGASVDGARRAWDRNPFDYALHGLLLLAVPALLVFLLSASLGPGHALPIEQPLVQINLR